MVLRGQRWEQLAVLLRRLRFLKKKPADFSAVMLRDNAAGVTVTCDET